MILRGEVFGNRPPDRTGKERKGGGAVMSKASSRGRLCVKAVASKESQAGAMSKNQRNKRSVSMADRFWQRRGRREVF